MTWSLTHLLIRFVAFGAAIAYACHAFKDVKVRPKPAIALVAVVFALLNAFLYTLIATAFNVMTLFAMWFAVPFVVNGILLLATDKLIKQFEIDGIFALLKTAGLLTAVHLILHFANI